jgi:myo-inositol-1(or 4)-monophosphatase
MAADLDLQEIHDFMISIALKAADMITSAHPTTSAAGNKVNC